MMISNALGETARPGGNPIDFSRDIRPLFAKHCTACHGGVKAAGNVSFLYREKALAAGKSGAHAVVPGKPESSEIMRRVTSTDPDEVMPKPDHGPALTAAEIEALRRWIAEGATWSEHWSFMPPVEAKLPAVKNSTWPRSVADVHILARLEAEGLSPSSEASPAHWLRRVSLDLTGLPPTPEAYQDFVKAWSSQPEAAKQRVVDELLASPSFGERWGSMWLDLARYSDTYGFEKDPHRDIWPWRDWVIRAFNADMPFDQFTIKQLAGDLLEQPTADDLLATAFHRNTQNNTEGGTDDEEYRTAAVLDRVNTTWTAWQATTFGCVQCHAHPYDPFPHPDYYRFAAFFNSSEDSDQDDDYPRFLFPKDRARSEEALQTQRAIRRDREALNQEGLKIAAAVTDWKTIQPLSATASSGTLSISKEGRIDASGTLPISVTYTLRVPAIPGTTAFRLDIEPDSSNPTKAPERGQIFSKLTAILVAPGISNQPVKFKEVIMDYLAGARDPRRVIEPEGGGGFGSYPVMTTARHGFLVLENPLPTIEGAVLQLTIDHGIAANSIQGCPLRHFSLSASQDQRLTDFVTFPTRLMAWGRWHQLRQQLKDLAGVNVPLMVERPPSAQRETRVFIRGNRVTLGDRVEPGIPNVVHPPQKTGALDRLDMARWLVGDANPLTARVLANRLWAEVFGRGIVETLEDFGTSGARPTHPELLDHLALRLRGELGWSIKRFLREIVLSATYAQSAKCPPDLLEKDPSNRLYARGPRVRLTAEMVRDQALVVSGQLAPRLFGNPVYPPQPDGIWSTVYSGDSWRTSKGSDRYRRSIYTYHRRTSGYPGFLTFDAPTRDACTARRIPSNTPLQALVTLNDPAFIELAQSLATRMEKSAATPEQRISFGAQLLTLDAPSPTMLDTLTRLYRSAIEEYESDPATREKLASTPERAALVLVANTLLNLDPFIVR
jgi:hypothetical protein